MKKESNSNIDHTYLVNKTMPKFWICPHCKKRNSTGKYADEIFIRHFKYIEHCPNCGYVHCWFLQLTEDFKKKVVNFLLNK